MKGLLETAQLGGCGCWHDRGPLMTPSLFLQLRRGGPLWAQVANISALLGLVAYALYFKERMKDEDPV